MTDVLKIKSGHGTEFEAPIAGLGARSYAFLIDWHIRVLVVVVWALGAILYLRAFPSDDAETMMLLFTPPSLFYLLYHPVIELFMEGNSPGKKYAKVRVVTQEGLVPSSGAILVRNVLRILDSLPMIYLIGIVSCVVTPWQRRIGDIAAGTLLVYDEQDEDLVDGLEDFLSGSSLNLQQLTALKTLLARWEDLESENRVKFGKRFLSKMDRSVPPLGSKKEIEERVHAELMALLPLE